MPKKSDTNHLKVQSGVWTGKGIVKAMFTQPRVRPVGDPKKKVVRNDKVMGDNTPDKKKTPYTASKGVKNSTIADKQPIKVKYNSYRDFVSSKFRSGVMDLKVIGKEWQAQKEGNDGQNTK